MAIVELDPEASNEQRYSSDLPAGNDVGRLPQFPIDLSHHDIKIRIRKG